MIDMKVIDNMPKIASNLRAVWPQIASEGIQAFRHQMLTDSFPQNKDGTRRYANSTKLINAFKSTYGDEFVEWSVDSIYGRVQFQGGTTHPKVTEKSRKFFWAMFFETGDPKWKYMALTKKTHLSVFIKPANPFYLSPGMFRLIKERLSENLFKVTST